MSKRARLFAILICSAILIFSLSTQAATKVGVYYNKAGLQFGHEGLKKALEGEGYEVKFIDVLNAKTFEGLDIVALSCVHQMGPGQKENDARKAVRDFAEAGGGVLLIHESVGWRKAFQMMPIFAEIGRGAGASPSPSKELVVEDKEHPITKGLSARFPIQYDMPALQAAKDGTVLVKSSKGDPELIVGTFGKGKVVLLGNLTGLGADNIETAPKDNELKLLLNSVKWLVDK